MTTTEADETFVSSTSIIHRLKTYKILIVYLII